VFFCGESSIGCLPQLRSPRLHGADRLIERCPRTRSHSSIGDQSMIPLKHSDSCFHFGPKKLDARTAHLMGLVIPSFVRAEAISTLKPNTKRRSSSG
jgi:hypothetical protein